MAKIQSVKQEFVKKSEQAIIDELKKRLETAIELKEQGKEKEGDDVVNGAIAWLEGLVQGAEKQVEPKGVPAIDRSVFPQTGEVLVEGNKVLLGVIKEDEKEKYLAVSCEYSCMKGMYKDEGFRDLTWKEFLSESEFVCSIYEKISGPRD